MPKKALSYCIVLTTVSSRREAEKIAKRLISKRLSACVNIIPGVKSYFRWKGETESAGELLLLLKTKDSRYRQVEQLVRKLHSYEVPEILKIPIRSGWKPYLDWIQTSVR